MAKGLFVGLAGMDIIYYSDNYPNRNDKSAIDDYKTFTGGPAANEAITFSMLGGDSTLITNIEESPIGDVIKANLESYSVRVIDLSKGIDILPFISAIMVDSNGERSIWSGQRKFPESDFTLEDCDFDFCMCDCYMYPHSMKILRDLPDSVQICLDVDAYGDHVYDYLQLADMAILSSKVWSSIDQGLLKPDLKIAITDNDCPIRILDSETTYSVPVEKVEAIDTLGAGDIFHGAFAYYFYDQGRTLEDSIREASGIATLSVKYHGTREWYDHARP